MKRGGGVKKKATYGVDKRLERLPQLWISDGLLPLVNVSPDEGIHLSIEVGANPQLVLEDNLAKLLDPTVKVFDPAGSSLETFTGSDVEHELRLGRMSVEPVGKDESRYLRIDQ